MFKFDKEKLVSYINKLSEPNILIIGDMGIDEMLYGNTERISREAPVLILRHSNTNIILGQAANAANNVAAINGGKVSVIGLYGDDYYGPVLLETFQKAGINTKYMVQDKGRSTTVKTRISGASFHSVTQQVVRIDRVDDKKLSEDVENRIIQSIEKAVPLHDAVILSDYNIGMLSDRVISAAVDCCKKHNKILVADIQKDMHRYKGVYALTPNQPDSEKAVGYFIKNEKTLDNAGKDILELTEAQVLLLTRGGEGMAVFGKDEDSRVDVPVFNKTNVFDVTGAGDTVVASFTLALAAGAEPKYAAIIGNIAASIVIRSFGCATTNIDELLDSLAKMNMKNYLIKA